MTDASLAFEPAAGVSLRRLPTIFSPASLVVLLAVVLCLVLLGGSLLDDPDTQWHIAVGRQIWSSGTLPTSDTYSHTFFGAPWIAKEWVSQLLLYAADDLGGWRGVVLVTAAAIGTAFALLFDYLSRWLRLPLAAALTLVAFEMAWPHLLARPHMLVLPVIVAWTVGLLSARDRGKAPPLLLAALMTLWVNMHGSFPLGLVIAGVLAGEAVVGAPPALRKATGVIWSLFLAAATALDYVASPEAARLATGQGGPTGRVAVLVPYPSRWFYGELLEALSDELRAADLDLLLFGVGEQEARRHFFERLPARRKVDAVVVLGFLVDDDEQRRLSSLGVHIVTAGGRVPAYPSVGIDDHAAARRAVDHLIHLGHRRIGMIADDDRMRLTADPCARTAGYRAAIAEGGAEEDPELLVSVPWGVASTMGSIMAKLPGQPPLTEDQVKLLKVDNVVSEAALRDGRTFEGLSITPVPLAAILPEYLVRFRVAGQFTQWRPSS